MNLYKVVISYGSVILLIAFSLLILLILY